MANEQNLIPINERTESEQRAMRKKAGKRSGEVRRENARINRGIKSAVKTLLSLPIKDPKVKKQLQGLGITDEEMDNAVLPVLGLFKKACKGDSAAARLLAELNGENDVQGVTKIGASGKLVFDFGSNEKPTEN